MGACVVCEKEPAAGVAFEEIDLIELIELIDMNVLLRYCVIALLCLLLAGCRTAKVIEQVPVEVHDTVYQKMVQRDSVFVDRWHSVEVKGDTVFVTNEVTKTKMVTKTDTAYRR